MPCFIIANSHQGLVSKEQNYALSGFLGWHLALMDSEEFLLKTTSSESSVDATRPLEIIKK